MALREQRIDVQHDGFRFENAAGERSRVVVECAQGEGWLFRAERRALRVER
ncbi:MAG TPA: hypothetical protein VN894_04270 [Polyangiaceae bacterium]|nr:hypothetical protein [Polyangiaceae bacterium]